MSVRKSVTLRSQQGQQGQLVARQDGLSFSIGWVGLVILLYIYFRYYR